jgi:hypothetical protein
LNTPVTTSAAISGTSDSLVVPNAEAATPAAGTVVTLVSPLSASSVVVGQPETGVASETLPSMNRVVDTGAGLSLVALATNKVASPAPTGSTNAKPATSALDEMYRLLPGTTLTLGGNLGVTGDDSAEELSSFWDIETMLLDRDGGDNAE